MAKGAFAATFLGVMATGYAAGHLALALAPSESTPIPRLAAGQGASAPGADAASEPWPAIFGAPPPPAPEPAPAAPAPVPSTRYTLKGLIAREDGGWAVLADGEREILVKVGDILEDGGEIVGIDRHGVTIARAGGFEIVSFGDDPPVTAAAPAEPGPAPDEGREESADFANIPTTSAEVDFTGLDPRNIRRIIARAGALEQTELADGTKALDLLWIRNGLVFDEIGLRAGDRILQINGVEAGSDAALMRAARQLLSSDTYRIEFLRNGQPMAVEVKVKRDG